MTVGDTDFFIDLMNPRMEHHVRALDVAQGMDAAGAPLRLTALTRFELYRGVERHAASAQERHRVQGVLESYPTIPLSPKAADLAGRIQGRLLNEGRRIGTLDALIAAIALRADEPLLTRNVREFERVQGLKVETY